MAKLKYIGADYKLEKPVEETILYEKVEPHIAVVTLNRPEVHNSLYVPDGYIELKRKVYMGVDDDDVKVIILRGKGRSFCTGDDLHRAPVEAWTRPGQKVPQSVKMMGARGVLDANDSILYCPKTIIVEAKGLLVGNGIMFVYFADLVVAAESAIFSHAEQRIRFAGFGPFPTIIPMLHMGPKRFREMMLTGQRYTAAQAKEWGIVNAVVPDDKLEEETMRWAKAVALHSTDGLMIGKLFQNLTYDLVGAGSATTATGITHPFFQNIVWRDDEFNWLRKKGEDGTTAGFKKREELWGELGF